MAKDLGEHKLADSAKEGAKKAACPDFVSGLFICTVYIVRTINEFRHANSFM